MPAVRLHAGDCHAFLDGGDTTAPGQCPNAQGRTDDFTNTWLATGSSPIKIGDRTVGTYELNGVHRNNDNGANMGMRCVGIYERGGTGPYHEHGACIFADKDGDQIMMTYESKDESSGTETLVAGTGKFAGISGTGEYKALQNRLHADDKVNRGIVAERHHWKLP